MLLLHGFTGSGGSWPPAVLDGLASAGLLPVVPDLPGHGRLGGLRDPARYTLDATLDVIGEAQAGEPGPVVGYSMGGRLALAYAVRYPERVTRLVLESASPGLATEAERAARRGSDEELARRLERDGIEPFVDHWEALPLFESRRSLPPELRAAQRMRRLAADPAGLAASLRGVGTGALPSFWNELPEVDLPVLLVVGGLDAKFRALADEMALRMPRAEVAVIEGAGHTVHLERPAAWLAAVLDFLGRR